MVFENCGSTDCMLTPDNENFVQLYSTGVALLEFRKLLKSSCEMDFHNFPFDRAGCKLKFYFTQCSVLSLMGNIRRIILVNVSTIIKYEGLSSESWNVISEHFYEENISAQISRSSSNITGYAIPGFVLELQLKRFPTYYIYNIIAPIIIISGIGMFTVVLPPDSDKINLAVTVLLSFFFVQTITGDLFPYSDDAPRLAKYTISALILSTLNLLACLIIVAVNNIDPAKKLPPIICRLFWYFSIIMLYQLNEKQMKHGVKTVKGKAFAYKMDENERKSIKAIKEGSRCHKRNKQEEIPEQEKFEVICDHEEHEEDRKETIWRDIANLLSRFFSLCYFVGAIAIVVVFLLPIFIDT